MEKLTINIPDKKSALVKQILKGLGVTIDADSKSGSNVYKQKIAKVSTWSQEDLKVFEQSSKAFNDLNAPQW